MLWIPMPLERELTSKADLIAHYRDLVVGMQEQIEGMRQGRYEFFEIRDGGRVNITDQAIKDTERRINSLAAVIAAYEREGVH